MADGLYRLVVLPDGTPFAAGFMSPPAPEPAAIAPYLGAGDGTVRRSLSIAGARLSVQVTREAGRALSTVSQGDVPVLCSVLAAGGTPEDAELLRDFVASMHEAPPLRTLARGKVAPFSAIAAAAERPLWAAILIPVVTPPVRAALLAWHLGLARAFFDTVGA
jgi:hypothetical protein